MSANIGLRLDKYEVRNHSLVWLLYLMLLHFLLSQTNRSDIVYMTIIRPVGHGCDIFIFYVLSLYAFPRLWINKKYFKLVVVLILLYGIHAIYVYLYFYYLIVWYDTDIFDGSMPKMAFLRYMFFWFLYYSLAAIIFFSYKHTIAALKRKNELESELIKTQYRFLKAQFNPHFLFNVLNYIYDKAISMSNGSALSRATLLLSDIMRYSMKSSNINGKNMLYEEVEYISNFIELSKIRYEGNIFVEFTVSGYVAKRKIVPLILISLIENAFKHGDLTDPNFPLSVHIRVYSETIFMVVKNKKQKGSKLVSHGIGIQNLTQRLDLAYKECYKLETIDMPQYYESRLSIQEHES